MKFVTAAQKIPLLWLLLVVVPAAGGTLAEQQGQAASLNNAGNAKGSSNDDKTLERLSTVQPTDVNIDRNPSTRPQWRQQQNLPTTEPSHLPIEERGI